MASVAGSIRQLAVDGRIFSVAADNDQSRDLGGYTNEVAPNGDGTARVIQTATQWMIDGITVACDPIKSDQEFLQEFQDGGTMKDCQVTYADGSVYSGLGIITGGVKYSNNTAFATFNLHGQGKLEKQ